MSPPAPESVSALLLKAANLSVRCSISVHLEIPAFHAGSNKSSAFCPFLVLVLLFFPTLAAEVMAVSKWSRSADVVADQLQFITVHIAICLLNRMSASPDNGSRPLLPVSQTVSFSIGPQMTASQSCSTTFFANTRLSGSCFSIDMENLVLIRVNNHQNGLSLKVAGTSPSISSVSDAIAMFIFFSLFLSNFANFFQNFSIIFNFMILQLKLIVKFS